VEPNQKFEARLLKIEEIDTAVDLLASQLREHVLPIDLVQARSVIEQIVNNDRLGFVLVAVEESVGPVGVALGCAFLGIEHSGVSGWLEELYVLPKFRERGVASLLIAEFIRVATKLGWRAIDLEIDSNHGRAASLYEQHGFVQLHRARWVRKLSESG
jgi:GNAT superfamily N-acetyltransferase